jgi:hypothetical protein
MKPMEVKVVQSEKTPSEHREECEEGHKKTKRFMLLVLLSLILLGCFLPLFSMAIGAMGNAAVRAAELVPPEKRMLKKIHNTKELINSSGLLEEGEATSIPLHVRNPLLIYYNN